MNADPSIQLAFRFHVNFYHSYRGDTPDETGVGKDIRLMRFLLDTLDALNEDGIGVRGTWDAENYYSLQTLIPRHCPDVLERMQQRVADGRDEVEIMGYNNGLLPAHTASELTRAIRWAVTNPQGSGVADLFAGHRTILRAQEMMWTPAFVRLLPALGIEAVTLFCSAVPFNSYGSFRPAPPVDERFSPVWLTAPGEESRIALIPAINPGDLAETLSLRSYLHRIRRAQLRLPEPRDLLVVIDMDADDSFWEGYGAPPVAAVIALARGLPGIVRSVAALPFVRFTTPGNFLDDHPPRGELSLDMDTADGAFDGYASWAEKWSNQLVWAQLERARILGWYAESKGMDPAARKSLDRALDARVRLLSTTHFGLASPVMNTGRLRDALRIARVAVAEAEIARIRSDNRRSPRSGLSAAVGTGLAFFTRTSYAIGDAVSPGSPLVKLADARHVAGAGSAAHLVPFPLASGEISEAGGCGASGVQLRREGGDTVHGLLLPPAPDMPEVAPRGGAQSPETADASPETADASPETADASPEPADVSPESGTWGSERSESERPTLVFSDPLGQNAMVSYSVARGSDRLAGDEDGRRAGADREQAKAGVGAADTDELSCGDLCAVVRGGDPLSLRLGEAEVTGAPLLSSSFVYGGLVGHRLRPSRVAMVPAEPRCDESGGSVRTYRGCHRTSGTEVWRQLIVLAGHPGLIVRTVVRYPRTRAHGCSQRDASRLGRRYDSRWREVMPAEVRPDLPAGATIGYQLWRESYLCGPASYRIPYVGTPNRRLDSSNNAVSPSWIAVSNGARGVLVVQGGLEVRSFAFCPLRVRRHGSRLSIRLNPHGTYWGSQLRSPLAVTGLGRLAAILTADHLHPLAPSYEGHVQSSLVSIAPYVGNRPPDTLIESAWSFSYPPWVTWSDA